MKYLIYKSNDGAAGLINAIRLIMPAWIIIGLVILFLSGCATPSNHDLLCKGQYIEIDITAANLCYPKFNRQKEWFE